MRRAARPRSSQRDAKGDRGGPPRWSTWRQAITVVCYRPHLRKTATIALVVGTVLFCINQLDVVVRGDATAVVWLKSAITYLVPFCVSNTGVLVASRVDRSNSADPSGARSEVVERTGDGDDYHKAEQ